MTVKSEISMVLKIILVYIVISFLAQLLMLPYSSQVQEWDQKISADVYRSQTMDAAEHYDTGELSLLNRGDRVLIYVDLPREEMVEQSALCFYVYHAIVNVYWKDQLLYSYGRNIYESGHMIGAVYPRVSIPDEAWGDELIIQLDITENAAFSRIQQVCVIPLKNSFTYFMSRDVTNYLIFLMTCIISLTAIVVLIFRKNHGIQIRKAIYISSFIFVISLWILSNYGMLNLFCGNAWVLAQIEYIALYFTPVPILLYIYESDYTKTNRHLMQVAIAELVIFDIIAVFLDLFTSIHFATTLVLFHMMGIIDMFLVLKYVFAGIKRKRDTETILMQGFIVLLVFIILDLVRFNMEKYIDLPFRVYNRTIAPVGVLFFIVALLGSYLVQIASNFVNDSDKRQLLKLAHTDGMTGLLNRAACDEKLQDMRRRNIGDYAIVFMDLNELKYLNDHQGHDMGDVLIRTFADAIQKVMGKAGWCGRMGGDEFIIGIEGEASQDVNIYMTELNELIDEINRKGKNPFKVSFASGIVISTEKNFVEYADAIELADQKMYENKRQMKMVNNRE